MPNAKLSTHCWIIRLWYAYSFISFLKVGFQVWAFLHEFTFVYFGLSSLFSVLTPHASFYSQSRGWIKNFRSAGNSGAARNVCGYGNMGTSMTQLLTHSVAHSTKPVSRPKTNNQSIKKFLSLAVSWVKVVKNWTSF